jgi:dTDP-4-dehydrorhamnose reductase
VIVVTGAAGQVGSAFRVLLGGRALYWDRRHLDLRRIDEIAAAVRWAMPTLVINCAAYTAVDAAETDAETARLVNATAVGELAAVCATIGAGLVTFSTDYVFDGTKTAPYVESDAPSPINVYGATKLEGEMLAVERHRDALVVRTSWVMSGTHRSFASTMVELIAKGEVRVVDDQRGRPTFADDLAAATLEAVARQASGLLHLTNSGEATWFDVASEIALLIGAEATRVSPCTSEEYPRVAKRPAYSVLDSERTSAIGLTPLPHWRDGLRRAVAGLTGP